MDELLKANFLLGGLSEDSVCFNAWRSPYFFSTKHDSLSGNNVYRFEKPDFPSKWIRWNEKLDYGNINDFETQTGCGAKAYEITCDNSLFNDDVVWLSDEGNLMISPYMMQSDEF